MGAWIFILRRNRKRIRRSCQKDICKYCHIIWYFYQPCIVLYKIFSYAIQLNWEVKKSSERHGIAPFAAKNYWLFPKILSALGIESSWESQSYSKKFFTELYRNVACKFPNFVHLKMKIKLKWISRVKCDEFIPKWNRIKLKCIYILFYFILLAQLRGGEPP